jgi:hypothetical protein
MRIKDKYKGCIVKVIDPILGERSVEVDRIKPNQVPLLKKYGFSFIFEVEQMPVDEYIYTDSPQVKKPKKPRKKRTNGKP